MNVGPPSSLLNPRQLSKVLGLSVGHVYRLVEQRRVPFCRIGGSVRFRVEAIDGWIRRQEVVTVGQVLRARRP